MEAAQGEAYSEAVADRSRARVQVMQVKVLKGKMRHLIISKTRENPPDHALLNYVLIWCVLSDYAEKHLLAACKRRILNTISADGLARIPLSQAVNYEVQIVRSQNCPNMVDIIDIDGLPSPRVF